MIKKINKKKEVKTKKILKVDLKVDGKTLLMRVLKFEESWRNKACIFESRDILLAGTNGANLANPLTSPKIICGTDVFGFRYCGAIVKHVVVVCGTNPKNDDDLCIVNFETAEKAIEIKEKIEKAVNDFNSFQEKSQFEIGQQVYDISDGHSLCIAWRASSEYIFKLNQKYIFETREEAERKLEILNFIHSKQTVFTVEEWENSNIEKYVIYAAYFSKKLKIDYHLNARESFFYYKTKKEAEKVADFIGYEDFIKYL